MRATRDHTGPRSDSILGQGFQPVQVLLWRIAARVPATFRPADLTRAALTAELGNV